jgi:hypothetical protein
MAEAKATTASVYRCAECGHGKHLTAWANVCCHGPLGSDGHLTEYDWDEEDWLQEDSIQCAEHPDAVVEKLIDGTWCQWYQCRWCLGDGRSCDEGFRPPGGSGKVHAGWRPVTEIAGLPALPGAGPGHVFALVPGRPGREATCRICQCLAGSIAGCKACQGDRHECPVVVPEGTPGAQRVYDSDRWHCYQPGKMNGDFTAWTCAAGHAITRAGHDHAGGRCEIPRSCPLNDLASGREGALALEPGSAR